MISPYYLASPLDIEAWEVIETLEQYVLYDEFAERIEYALQLLEEGQRHWQEHQSPDGEWSEISIMVVSEVRRLSYNISQKLQISDLDIAACIRSTVGISSESNVSNSQCMAALAIDRACRAIETLGKWLADFQQEFHTTSPETLDAIARESPDDFEALINEPRREWAQVEMETRENTAEILGNARHYLILAAVYALPILSDEDKTKISTAARSRGLRSAELRRRAVTERNDAICAKAHTLRKNGVAEKDLVGMIAHTATAEKESGGVKLSKKQIRNILRAGGALDPDLDLTWPPDCIRLDPPF
ncbi:hypothetical protein [Pseudomonas segetis]|uniref:hypothetical protein n=1 Tax=Pseudomonas segetis TaxID=298908 RepID=UPI001130CCD7|nr:hypothetical protein [Pseudomonas segetis]